MPASGFSKLLGTNYDKMSNLDPMTGLAILWIHFVFLDGPRDRFWGAYHTRGRMGSLGGSIRGIQTLLTQAHPLPQSLDSNGAAHIHINPVS